MPSITSGGSGFSADNEIQYYRMGNLVLLSWTFWTFNITNPTNENIYLSLPYKVVSPRAYGVFGYNNSGKNLVPLVITNNNNVQGLIFNIKNENGSIQDVKGTDLTTFIGQMSVVYATDGTKLI